MKQKWTCMVCKTEYSDMETCPNCGSYSAKTIINQDQQKTLQNEVSIE